MDWSQEHPPRGDGKRGDMSMMFGATGRSGGFGDFTKGIQTGTTPAVGFKMTGLKKETEGVIS